MATAPNPTQLNPWWGFFRPSRRAEPTALVVAGPPTPSELLHLAVSQNADLDKLKQLMDLHERWERSEAKKAYVVAMNAFKANPPLITKNEIAKFISKDKQGNTVEVEWEYSTLDHIHDAVLSELSRHGISHRWVVEQPRADTVRVTCILTHKLGHSEQTTLEGPVDHSGSKNAIQAIGSSAKYLERYTLMAATGLADKSPDTDGLASSTPAPNNQFNDFMRLIQKAANSDQLRDAFTAAYRSTKDRRDQAAFIAAKDARLKGLR